MYEYAANGSLAGFFKDDHTRASLPAEKRLRVMFELAKAVHCLHTGNYSGLKVFHRDIKSENICLAEDFTAKLIDYGLVKFRIDENSDNTGSIMQIGSTKGAVGTPGYMCPEYSREMLMWSECPFIPAYDVFSIGIVMAELILGRLNQNVYQTYVKKDEHTMVTDGLEQLQKDADKKVDWQNQDALQLVCRTAIGCITPDSNTRLGTEVIMANLEMACQLIAASQPRNRTITSDGQVT